MTEEVNPKAYPLAEQVSFFPIFVYITHVFVASHPISVKTLSIPTPVTLTTPHLFILFLMKDNIVV